ncbi:hypothetical protein P3S68_023349 [Capsicum galapagoense]
MSNWVELPNDPIAHIAKRVKVIEDFIAFRAVCTSWRNATTKDNFDVLWPQFPLLMLGYAKDYNYLEFYSLSKKKVSRLYIPEATWRTCFPSKGWFICFLQSELEIRLLNLFSHNKIQLPGKNLWPLQGYEGPKEKALHSLNECTDISWAFVGIDYACQSGRSGSKRHRSINPNRFVDRSNLGQSLMDRIDPDLTVKSSQTNRDQPAKPRIDFNRFGPAQLGPKCKKKKLN